ncbi:MAG: right-handed parallel beta-helix repeat-containing protein, partial [Planctomycetes bacterium]|nr:right-handed parallel beta-helix repeat-containing protein [Planctomycetota bacterium]
MQCLFRARIIWTVMLLIALGAQSAAAVQHYVTDEASLAAALSIAADGDEVLLAPGTYTDHVGVSNLTGVTIRSADPNNQAIIDGSTHNDAMRLQSPVRVTIADLIITGAGDNGLHIDAAAGPSAQDVTIRNVTVLDTNPDGNHDAIKLSGVYGFHVDGVYVNTWGGSAIDMVGCHNGLIENSLFDNTGCDELSGTGVRPKGGSTHITIRANRLINANERPLSFGGSTGLQWFDPQPPGDVEADYITAEGNVLISPKAGICYINIDDHVVARKNVLYRPNRWVMRIQKENTNPGFVDTQKGSFIDNIVLWEEGDIHLFVGSSAGTMPETFTFAGNQWYNMTEPSNSTPDLPAAETGGTYGIDPQVDIDDVIPWAFDWGTWLVNANTSANTYTVSSPQTQWLAQPAEGASLDMDLDYPLVGTWTFSTVSGPVGLDAFSQSVLINAILVAADGDTDLDADIDAMDLAQLGVNWAPSGTGKDWSNGDFDEDGDVDARDLAS